jgi:hypothetical protein
MQPTLRRTAEGRPPVLMCSKTGAVNSGWVPEAATDRDLTGLSSANSIRVRASTWATALTQAVSFTGDDDLFSDGAGRDNQRHDKSTTATHLAVYLDHSSH